jgi:hypothetical protein
MNSKEFSLKIEDIVKEKKCSYLDAVVLFCDENEIDPSTTKPLISKSLKEKIKIEAIDKKLIKETKSGKLPV